MCKAGQTKTGGGVLARMRHLQGQIGESSPQSLGEKRVLRQFGEVSFGVLVHLEVRWPGPGPAA